MKKFISAALVPLMLLTLVSCGSKEEKPYKDQSLTVLYMSGVYADAAHLIVDEFEEATGATVNVVELPYQALHDQGLEDMITAGGAYDVIDVPSQWDGEFAPYLESLEPYIQQDEYDKTVWIDNVLANCGEWQGDIIGIPNANTPQVFAYRTDLLPDGIPDTWDEYLAVLEQVNDPASGLYGATVSEWSALLSSAFDYVLWSMGGNWADEDWNVTIDSAETRAALEFLYKLKDFSDPDNLNWDVYESTRAFLNGNAAVCQSWPTMGLTQNGDNPEESQVVGKWALDMIPHDKTGITLLSAWDVAIPAGSQNKELAWEWIKMYTSYENQNRFYDELGILSPRKEFWEQNKIKEAGLYPLREALDTANMWWRIPASAAADTLIDSVARDYLLDEIDLETAVSQMDEGLKAVLENNPPEEGIKNYNH